MSYKKKTIFKVMLFLGIIVFACILVKPHINIDELFSSENLKNVILNLIKNAITSDK